MAATGDEQGAGPWPELARRLVDRPARAALLLAVTALAAGALAAARLSLSADRMDLIGRQHAYARHFAQLQDDFGDVDSIVVLVKAPTREGARAFADDLAARLARAPGERFRGVFYRVPDEALRGKALLFLDIEDLLEVERRLALAAPGLRAFGQAGAAGLLEHAAARTRALLEGGEEPRAGPDDARDLELLGRLIEGLGAALEDGAGYAPAWRDLIPSGVQARDGYVWTRDGRLVLLVEPRARAGAERLASVEDARAIVRAAAREGPGVEVGITGGPVLEADERATFVRDAMRAAVASLLGLVLVAVASLRRLVAPLLVVVGLCWAAVVALGLAAAWPGHLNLVTVVVAPLLLGLGADGALHLVTRHDEARAAGVRAGRESVASALAGAGGGATAAALTVALAFMATLFTDVEGIREFGVLAGAGLLLCLVATLALVPPLLAWADPPGRPPHHRPAGWWLSRVDALLERQPAAVLVVAAALALGGVALALTPEPDGRPRLRYEPNLLRLQARSLESVRLATEVLEDEAVTGMFATIVVEDLAGLERVEAAVRRLPSVSRAESLLDVVPPDQPRKLEVLARLSATLEGVLPALETGPPPDEALARAERAAEALQAALEEAARASLAAGRGDAAASVLGLQERLEALAPQGDPARRARRAAALLAWQDALRADLREALGRLRDECAAERVTLDDLPSEVRARFVGKSGRYLLRVYPAGDIWDRTERGRFLDDLKRIVPDVGGFPAQLQRSDELLTAGVRKASLFALVFVALALLVAFRTAAVPLVAVATVLVGAGWAAGVLALARVELNPASLLAAPLALGVGMGHVIHLARRDREARRVASAGGPQPVLGTSTGRAVVLSGLTSLVAFGALGLSDHHGLATLGESAFLGAAACLVAALVVTPALLRLRAGPWRWPLLLGLRGPKTGPGGRPRRPPEPEAPPGEG